MTVHSQFDVLIVGAGPAGSAAACAAASRGARVLVVERKQCIGAPVQCAEYIPALLLGKVELGREFTVQAVKGMKTYLPDAPEKKTRAPGYIIHRDRFDRAMARKARAAGAKIMLSTRALRMDSEGYVALVDGDGSTITLRPKVLIGAYPETDRNKRQAL